MGVVIRTTSGVGDINPFANAGDTYVVASGVVLGGASETTLGSSNYGRLIVEGTVVANLYGAVGIYNNGVTSFVTTQLSVGSNGLITADQNTVVIAGRSYISNNGTINQSFYNNSSAITVDGINITINNGIISAANIAFKSNSNASSDTVQMYNTGTITGVSGAYIGAASIDRITNTGTMSGAVTTGGGNDSVFNFGKIYGNIDLGADNDTLYTDLSQVGPYTLAGGSGSDTLVNTDNSNTASINLGNTGFEIYYGGNMASYVYGGTATAALIFVGRGAADAFIGGSGADVVIGGAGGDYLDGGAGVDALSYSTSLQGVTVNLGAGTASGGDATGDIFLNFENIAGSAAADVLIGDGNANTLAGDAGNDFLFGGGGADFLIGGAGNDYMSGGIGNDIFYFAAPGFGSDEITDFTRGQDKLYISTSIAANFAGMVIFQYGADAYVGAGGTYFHLDNTVASTLTASDFVFF